VREVLCTETGLSAAGNSRRPLHRLRILLRRLLEHLMACMTLHV
jgi:hypothetical protein